MEKLTEKLFTVKYKQDAGRPHIEIVNQAVCADECKGKFCTHFCPAGVYEWNEEQKKTLGISDNCIDWGACSIGCPYDNISSHCPRGAFATPYKLGNPALGACKPHK